MFKRITLLGILLTAPFFAQGQTAQEEQTVAPLHKNCSVEAHESIMVVGVEVKSADHAMAEVNLKTAEGELAESCQVGYVSDSGSTVMCNLGGVEIKLWLFGSTSSLTMNGPDMEGRIVSNTAAMKCSDIAPEEVD